MNVNEVPDYRDLSDGYEYDKGELPAPLEVTPLTPEQLAARPARIAAEIAEDNGPREFRTALGRKLARMTAECREKSLALPFSKGPLVPAADGFNRGPRTRPRWE